MSRLDPWRSTVSIARGARIVEIWCPRGRPFGPDTRQYPQVLDARHQPTRHESSSPPRVVDAVLHPHQARNPVLDNGLPVLAVVGCREIPLLHESATRRLGALQRELVEPAVPLALCRIAH